MAHTAHRVNGARADRSLLAVNSGSSSIKFGLFTFAPEPCRSAAARQMRPRAVSAVSELMQHIAREISTHPLAGVGHRIVHGGPRLFQPQRVTPEVVTSLRQMVRFAPNHLPDELRPDRSDRAATPGDAAVRLFRHGVPCRSSRWCRRHLAVPERMPEGVRRYGFHGLSYTFLLDELQRRTGTPAAGQKIVLAHLGNGSSLAAVRDGRSHRHQHGPDADWRRGHEHALRRPRSGRRDLHRAVDGFQRRPGRARAQSPRRASRRISGGTTTCASCSRVRRATSDVASAVAIYCYASGSGSARTRRRWGASTRSCSPAASANMRASSAPASARSSAFSASRSIRSRNSADAPLISTPTARVAVHVIPTDEEVVIARSAYDLLH